MDVIRYLEVGARFNPLLKKKFNKKVENNFEFLFESIYMSLKNQFIYFRVPKAANSTIVKTLNYYEVRKFSEDKSISYYKRKSNSLKRTLIKHFLFVFPKKYFVFTFVRNPYTRVLSCYLDKFKGKRYGNKFEKIIKKHKINSFERFIQYLESGGLHDNLHWTPQIDILPKDFNEMDFIGKIENIDEDLSFCIKRIFGKKSSENFQIKNARPHRTNSSKKTEQYYTKNLQKRVYRLYKRDFIAFKYDKNIVESEHS